MLISFNILKIFRSYHYPYRNKDKKLNPPQPPPLPRVSGFTHPPHHNATGGSGEEEGVFVWRDDPHIYF